MAPTQSPSGGVTSPQLSRPLDSRLMAAFFLGAAVLQVILHLTTPADLRPVLWVPVTLAYAVVGGWVLASQHRRRHPRTMPLLIGLNLALLSALVLSAETLTAPWSFLFLWDIPFIWAVFRTAVRVVLSVVQSGVGASFVVAELARLGSPTALVHGALVYLATALVLGWCTRAIVQALRTAQERSDALAQHAEHSALHDPLTGLGNRVMYPEQFRSAVARSARSGTDVAVVLLDLDQFKLVNDSLGHDVGDALLQAVSRRLEASLRASDSVARLGGDEFVVVLEGLQASRDAVTAAAHLQDSLRDPVVTSSNEFFVTASIGVTVVAGRSLTPEQALREADSAMYRAKRRGRGMVEFFDEALRDAVTRQLQLEDGLRRALDRDGELGVVYQPIVEVATGRVVGAEALARWVSPELGTVHAAEFIPVAENSGLIVRLGARVLTEALGSASRWRPTHPAITVAVNVSPHQLHRGDFTAMVEEVVTRFGASPGTLHLEITESVALSEDPATQANIARLTALGVRFSLDDFGTGYSSIAALRRLPLSHMKVDRSLHTDEPVLRACLDLGRALGLTVVAEGIESEEARARVVRVGYDLAQGFLFGRPMPADRFGELLDGDVAGGGRPVARSGT